MFRRCCGSSNRWPPSSTTANPPLRRLHRTHGSLEPGAGCVQSAARRNPFRQAERTPRRQAHPGGRVSGEEREHLVAGGSGAAHCAARHDSPRGQCAMAGVPKSRARNVETSDASKEGLVAPAGHRYLQFLSCSGSVVVLRRAEQLPEAEWAAEGRVSAHRLEPGRARPVAELQPFAGLW